MKNVHKNKIILLGDSGVGKTSIVRRWITNTFYENQSPTIGSAYIRTSFIFKGEEKEIQVWDTAGEERFRSMAPMYSKDSFAAIIVFSLTSHSSFESVPYWIQMVIEQENIPILLLGNKIDCDNSIEVQQSEPLLLAQKYNCDYYSTSALTGISILESFETLLNKAFQRIENNKTDYIVQKSFLTKNISNNNNNNKNCC